MEHCDSLYRFQKFEMKDFVLVIGVKKPAPCLLQSYDQADEGRAYLSAELSSMGVPSEVASLAKFFACVSR